MARIGIIDDWVNPKYLSEKLRIRYIFAEGVEREIENQVESLLTHATVIIKILEQQTKDYEVLNFVLTKCMDEPVDIRALKKALELCQEEEIDVFCMSLGTDRISEINYIYPQIRRLYERDVILIAAADNDGRYMLPAAFEEVIGVEAVLEGPRQPGKYYLCENSLWNIDLQADCRFPVQLKGKDIYPSTSYAVPVIAAQANLFFNQGFRGQDEIRIQLKKYAAGCRAIRRDIEKNGFESSLPVVGSCELDGKEWVMLMDLMQSQSGLEVIGLDAGGKIKDGRFLKPGRWKEEKWEHMICWVECYTVADLVFASLPEEKGAWDILIRKTKKAGLLLRFFEPDEGRIYIDGLEIKNCKLESYRALFSVVSQDIYLFCDTVRNNVIMGEDADDKLLKRISENLQLHSLFQSLPKGYDSVLEGNGENLSGGERQKIALLRAMVKDAPILIFDEATAHIDKEYDTFLHDYILREFSDKTMIMITHKRGHLEGMDRVYEIKGGVV